MAFHSATTIAKQREQTSAEADLIGALAGTDASAEICLAYKTRRLIHGAILNLRERRGHFKRSLALAIGAIIAFLVVLSPVIWNAMVHLGGEEHFGDLQTQLSLLLLFALSAVLAALLLMGKARKGENHGRRQS